MELDPTSGLPSSETIHWEAVLTPHRSLHPRGFLVLMLCLSVVSFVSGVVFVSIGAWPVFGFFGIDVMLLYFAFRMNYRDARQCEILRLSGDDFVVEKIGVRGEVRQWRTQAFWLRVVLSDAGAESVRLRVVSHGKAVTICGFMNADETRQIAADLTAALERWRDGLVSSLG